MKIEREHVVDELIGDVKTNKFKIGEDSMGIIIDSLINLYSDPIGSIVREVTSNCYDAHREKELKIKHFIPMTKEDDPKWFHDKSKKPQIEFQEENILLGIGNAFLFRDFGVGLSKNRVEEIYTLFGNSTKRDNNHQIGGFGIGAKSPFSYTDTFYIISNHNGQKFSYMLYRGNDAFHMDLMKTSNTTELNSTEVIIPINSEDSYRDIKNFVKAINNQLTYFIGLEFINIEEGSGKKVESTKIDYEDDDIAISVDKDADRYSTDELHLMVGRVRYPLNQEMVDSQVNWRSEDIPCAMKFEVGELDLVPSREAIRYTDKTKDAIKDKILKIQKNMKQVCEKELANCSDVIDWMKHASALKENSSHYGKTYDSVFSVQSYLAKMEDDNADCTLHGVKLSGSLLDDTYRQSRLFRGFSVMTVKRESNGNYVGGFKLSKSQPKLSDLIKLPIYYQKQADPDSEETRKVFLKSKDFYLAEKEGKFLQIRENWSITDKDVEKEKEIDMWNSNESAREADVIKSDFQAMKTLFGHAMKKFHMYDDVDMSKVNDELGETMGDYESEQDRRKRLGKAFLRRIYFHDNFGEFTKVRFSNDEYHIDDLHKYKDRGGIVIYGNSKDDELLKNIAALYRQAGKYSHNNYSTNSLNEEEHPTIILKVAATLNKQLTNFINVNDLAPMKDPILVNWYTAKLTRNKVDDIYFFSMFEKLNSDLYYKWKHLKENHENNYEQFHYMNRGHEDGLAAMCKTNDCINHKMIDNLKELRSYSNSLDLLKHLEFAQLTERSSSSIPSKEVFLALREYLRFKGKAVVKFKKQKKKEGKDLVNV